MEEEEGFCCCDCEDERKEMAPKEPRVAAKIAISSSTTRGIRFGLDFEAIDIR